MMSVNCRLTNRTLAAAACSNARCFVAALSGLGIVISASPNWLLGASAQGGANFERELQVEARLGVFQVRAAEQLLDALESVNQRIAVHVQVARRAHVVAASPQERVQRAH